MSLMVDERPASDRSEVLHDFIGWLNRRFALDGRQIAADTPLFSEGWIDSIGILHLIAWVERGSGRQIPDRLIRIDYFETPAMIVERFFGSEAEEAIR